MVRLALKILAFVPAMSLVAWMNYTLDPVSLFRDGCEGVMADAILSGHNVGIPIYTEDRLLHRQVIQRLLRPADVIALGSSRGMQMRAAHVNELSFFNHSVSAGRLEDFLALYGKYVVRGLKPQWMILELDPWLVNQSSERPRLKHLDADYRMMCRILGVRPRPGATPVMPGIKYAELVSPNYFQAALRLWIANSGRFRRSCREIEQRLDWTGNAPMVLADGSLMHARGILEEAPTKVRRRAQQFMAARGFLALQPDEAAQKELEAFLRLLISQGVQVVFVLPPFHPVVTGAQRADGSYSGVAAAEEYFRSLANQYRLPVLGSFDAAVCGCHESEFIDALHPKDSCLARILSGWTADYESNRSLERFSGPPTS